MLQSSDIQTFAHSPCTIGGLYVVSGGLYRTLRDEDFNGVPLDFSGKIVNTISGEYIVQNPCYSTIGFYSELPSGMTVSFQGTFDGTHYVPITFRQIEDDGYTQGNTVISDVVEKKNYIGSIASLKAIKFVTLSTGLPGVDTFVAGRMVAEVSTLEGIENSAPPHSIGNKPFHKGINITGGIVNEVIYQPQDGYTFAVTDIKLSASSTAGSYVTLYESGNVANPDNWIFSVYVKCPENDTKVYSLALSLPFVSSSGGAPLCIDSSAPALVRGVVHGYYIV